MNKFTNMFSIQKRLSVYAFFLALGALITFISLMASPSDPKNAVLLGYSLERMLLGAAVLVPGIALLFLTLSLLRQPEHSQRLWETLFQRKDSSHITLTVAVAAFLSLWTLLFLPSYRLGSVASYVSRLLPILIWLLIVSGVTILILLLEQRQVSVQESATGNRIILKAGLIALVILLIMMLIISITGIGIRYPADYWYGAGVPVLGLQILFSLFAGAIFLLFDKKLDTFNPLRLDIFIFAALWIVAAWFWAQEPLTANYFMPNTADNVIYPYSDGATFDVGAQYALIGQGIFNGKFFERSLYSVFLVYLHMLLGQDFAILMTAQAALFAVLPALTYLLGRELHSRALGISVGILLAIRGVNAIAAAKWIDTASPKMVLTDFPAAIGIAIFLLLFLKWLKEPSRISRLLWAGAVFALTFMVRSNVLTLLPVFLVLIPFFVKINWKQFILVGLLVLLGLLTVTLPWELRNQSYGTPMYSMYYSRILTVLRYRYGLGGDAYLPPSEASIANARDVRDFARQRIIEVQATVCESTPCSIVNHFLHNAVTAFVSLPSSLILDDLWNIIKADTPYWKQDWNAGTVGTVGTVMIVLNLAVISLGVGSMWARVKVFALLPILVFVTYLLTNSLGLTSGGRYVAPVDWIVYIYFIAGGLQLVAWFLRTAGFEVDDEVTPAGTTIFEPLKKAAYVQALPTLAFILAIGALLPVSEIFFQPRYQSQQPVEILDRLEKAGYLEQSGYSKADLIAFLSQPKAMIREGRALYPRYYPSGDGEQDRSTYYRYLDYHRLVFTLIGPYSAGAEGVVIPGYAPPVSFHAEDVVVLGCWNTTYYAPFIDAVVVFSTSGEGYVYNRAPESPLQCPLETP